MKRFSVSLADAEESIAKGEAHLANYRAVVRFDPPDAHHEYMFARESLRIAKAHLADAEDAMVTHARAFLTRTCRVCGCTHKTPCMDRRSGETCHWVARDLCSACQQPRKRGTS